LASGSGGNQIINVYEYHTGKPTTSIRYHDDFLGQRIGPISCLAFHPLKMLLAAGATDSIVSIYASARPQ
jgi:regulator-associated protein of mTOR